MKNSKESIELLILNFKNGSSEAFKVLFEKHRPGLISFVHSYTNDQALTQDIVQDAFIKLWDARRNIENDKSIVAYLYKIAYYIFINNYRKHKKESKLLDALAYKAMSNMNEIDSDVQEQRIKKVLAIIETLPPRCKEIFKMSKFQGYKYHEIAELLKISEKAVEAQMSTAFRKIRAEFKDSGSLLLFFNFIERNVKPKGISNWLDDYK